MPINNEDRTKLELAVASFETQDSVAVARLLWETLNAARATPDNQGGLGPDQVFALGRLIYDKAEWPALAKVEEATGRRPIRFPLMRAVESVFRARLSNSLPKLPEEHRQALGLAMSKMDPDELKLLTVLLYDTIISAEFITTEDAKVMHPVAKFLAPGWTWDQLKQMEPVVTGVCIPLVNACHAYFREHFPTIFRTEEEIPTEAPPAEALTPTPTPTSPAAPPEVETQTALSPDEEEAAASDEEGGVSDSDPFVTEPPVISPESSTESTTESTTETSTAVKAQAEEDDTHTPHTPIVQETAETEPMPVPTVKDERAAINGHKLSKKERREMKRQQREEAGK